MECFTGGEAEIWVACGCAAVVSEGSQSRCEQVEFTFFLLWHYLEIAKFGRNPVQEKRRDSMI